MIASGDRMWLSQTAVQRATICSGKTSTACPVYVEGCTASVTIGSLTWDKTEKTRAGTNSVYMTPNGIVWKNDFLLEQAKLQFWLAASSNASVFRSVQISTYWNSWTWKHVDTKMVLLCCRAVMVRIDALSNMAFTFICWEVLVNRFTQRHFRSFTFSCTDHPSYQVEIYTLCQGGRRVRGRREAVTDCFTHTLLPS